MGLEYLELIMEVEDAFNIKLDDKQAGSIRTVGDFCDWVRRELKESPTQHNSFDKAFNLLKKTICEQIPAVSNLIPDTPSETVFPAKRRKYWWKRIEKASGLTFPVMVVRKKYSVTPAIIFWFLIFAIFIGFRYILSIPFLFWQLLLASFVSLFIGIIILLIMDRFAFSVYSIIPPHSKTLRNLTNALIALNPNQFKPFDKDAVFTTVAYMIADHFDIAIETIKPETRFIEDLGF